VLVVLPMIVPGLVTRFIWKLFYDPNPGILNRLLDVSGLKGMLVFADGLFGWDVFHAGAPMAWLNTPELIVPSLIILVLTAVNNRFVRVAR
jgi:raffinose/stachyose/melibiose transport system permease protein